MKTNFIKNKASFLSKKLNFDNSSPVLSLKLGIFILLLQSSIAGQAQTTVINLNNSTPGGPAMVGSWTVPGGTYRIVTLTVKGARGGRSPHETSAPYDNINFSGSIITHRYLLAPNSILEGCAGAPGEDGRTSEVFVSPLGGPYQYFGYGGGGGGSGFRINGQPMIVAGGGGGQDIKNKTAHGFSFPSRDGSGGSSTGNSNTINTGGGGGGIYGDGAAYATAGGGKSGFNALGGVASLGASQTNYSGKGGGGYGGGGAGISRTEGTLVINSGSSGGGGGYSGGDGTVFDNSKVSTSFKGFPSGVLQNRSVSSGFNTDYSGEVIAIDDGPLTWNATVRQTKDCYNSKMGTVALDITGEILRWNLPNYLEYAITSGATFDEGNLPSFNAWTTATTGFQAFTNRKGAEIFSDGETYTLRLREKGFPQNYKDYTYRLHYGVCLTDYTRSTIVVNNVTTAGNWTVPAGGGFVVKVSNNGNNTTYAVQSGEAISYSVGTTIELYFPRVVEVTEGINCDDPLNKSQINLHLVDPDNKNVYRAWQNFEFAVVPGETFVDPYLYLPPGGIVADYVNAVYERFDDLYSPGGIETILSPFANSVVSASPAGTKYTVRLRLINAPNMFFDTVIDAKPAAIGAATATLNFSQGSTFCNGSNTSLGATSPVEQSFSSTGKIFWQRKRATENSFTTINTETIQGTRIGIYPLTVSHIDEGAKFRALFFINCTYYPTNEVTLNVNSGPLEITQQPVLTKTDFCAGEELNLSAKATGEGAMTVQWFKSDIGISNLQPLGPAVPYTSNTVATYTKTLTASDKGTYAAIFSSAVPGSTCPQIYTNFVTIAVADPTQIPEFRPDYNFVGGMPYYLPAITTISCTNTVKYTIIAYVPQSPAVIKYQRKGAGESNYTNIVGSETNIPANAGALIFNASYSATLTSSDNGASYRAVILNNGLECAAVYSEPTIINYVGGSPGEFGDNSWNVYAWNSGGAASNSDTWNTNYAGYYTDTNLNFDSEAKWGKLLSPSNAMGYQGCTVNNENFSFSARRQGFPCGYYQIDIPAADDEWQLWINDAHIQTQPYNGAVAYNDVWRGYLGGTDKVEFRVTEGDGDALGKLNFTAITRPDNPSVFGDNSWIVYAWNSGGAESNSDTWNTNYAGYYIDENLNFDSEAKWGKLLSPSSAMGYQGCAVNNENFSFSARRQGFPCGYYQIDIPAADDEWQLWINDAHIRTQAYNGAVAYNDVWRGYLGGTDKVEFRVTEGDGDALGKLHIILIRPVYTLPTENISVGQEVSDPIFLETGCKILATIIPMGSNPVSGYVDAKVWIETVPPFNLVPRHYEITPQNNPNLASAKITLYFSQADFDAYNNNNNSVKLPIGPDDSQGKANIEIVKYTGFSENGLPSGYPNQVPTLIPNSELTVTWEDNYWAISFNVTGFSGFFVKTTSQPLPVTLISFTGKAIKNGNQLNWKTANERNFSHFEVQKSTDSKEFGTIATLLGNKSRFNNYIDQNPIEGNNYYRLKMVDLDGSYNYSKIIQINFDKGQDFVTVENPVQNGEFRVITNIKAPAFSLFNNLGVKVEINVESQFEESYLLKLKNSIAGMYYLKINSNEKTHIRKLLIF